LTGGYQLLVEETEGGDTTIILQALGQFEATTASLAPRHNNQQQKQSFVIAKKWKSK
jgi:hypothetical protein